jgi:biotin carboxylase
MILGAGVMQLPAIRLARKNSIRVIAMDGNIAAAGVGEADLFENVDLKDVPKLIERAAHYKELGMLDGVFTAGTDFSLSVALIAEQLGLPGISPETARNASDKSRMRAKFLEHNVPSPRFFSITAAEIDGLDECGLSFPLVVKPVDNMGARGVEMVQGPKELREKALRALSYSRANKLIVEEFIEGPEFSIDALVYEDTVAIHGLAVRHIYFPPSFVEMGHTMPAVLSEKERQALERDFISGIRALGIDTGAAKGDIFLTDRGPVIGEIAARLSGGYMSGWTYPYSSGVDLTLHAMRIALGLSPGDFSPTRSWTSAERAFISIPGKAARIEGLSEAGRVEGVKDVFVRVREGDRVRFPANNIEKCGNIISALPADLSARGAAEKAVSEIFIRLEKDDEETRNFLFMKHHPCLHGAFDATTEAETPLKEMPWYRIRSEKAGERCDDMVSFGPFRVLSFRPLPDTRSWSYSGFAEELEKLKKRPFPPPHPLWKDELLLGRVFWRAYFRGGLQGALWLLDSLSGHTERHEAEELLCEWADLTDS